MPLNHRLPPPSVPQRAPSHTDPPVSSTVAAPSATEESSDQRPSVASILANPSLPFPIQLSLSNYDDSSLPRPVPAGPGLSGPSSINDPLPDAVDAHETTDDNSTQVHGSANEEGFTRQDNTDHGLADNSTRASIAVDPALKMHLTFPGSYLDPEKYDPVKLLGSGGFAKVIMCFLILT